MKKKLLMYFLMLMLAFSFTACSSDDDDSSSKRSEREKDDEDEDDEDDVDEDKDKKKDKDKDKNKDDEDTKSEAENEDDVKSDDENEDKKNPFDKDNMKDEDDVNVKEDVEDDSDNTSSEAAVLSDNLFDYQVSIDGVVYQLPMWASDFEAMGWEYQGDYDKMIYSDKAEYDNWTKDGMEVWTDITNFSINATPLKDCLITNIEVDEYSFYEGQECELANGIKVNVSTQDDVIAAYGEPDEIYEGWYTYLTYTEESWVKEVEFGFEDNILITVEILNEIELDGFDNTFYDERPSFIDDYETPTEPGAELFDAILQLDGNYYSLPCPVQAFLDNGFEFDDYYNNYEYVCSGDVIYCNLIYDDKYLDVTIKNFSEYATAKENCYVIGVTDVNYDSNVWDMEVFAGLKVDSTEDELLSVIDGYEYNLYEGDNYNSYNLYAEEWNYTNSLYFNTENGIVKQISIFCEEHPENK